MAMPIASMIKHFRAEFEEHMERVQLAATEMSRGPHAGPYDVARARRRARRAER